MIELLSLLKKAIYFTVPVLLIMGAGLAAAEILTETGALKKISKIGHPLSRFAHLPESCGVAVVTAVVSPLAANAMLQNMRESGLITDRETFFASLMTGALAPLKETFTYHLPVILPALGFYAGAVYIGTLWLGTFAILLFVMIGGRFLLKNRGIAWHDAAGLAATDTSSPSLRNGIVRFLKRFCRIGGTFFVVTLIVFILMETGIMSSIESLIMPLAKRLNLSSVILPAVAAYIASPIVGISMMGSLLRNHTVTEHQVIVALLFGSIFMLPVLYLRFYLPQWISIFGLKLGMARGLTSASLVMAVRVIVLIAFMSI